MRLIDADKLKPDCLTKDGKFAISQSQIANAPTVEQPQGEWVEQRDTLGRFQLYCNQCGAKAQVGFVSFCGKCGADMRGGAE